MTNEQAVAYAVMAMKECGLDGGKIREIASQMDRLFDRMPERAAEQEADSFLAGL